MSIEELKQRLAKDISRLVGKGVTAEALDEVRSVIRVSLRDLVEATRGQPFSFSGLVAEAARGVGDSISVDIIQRNTMNISDSTIDVVLTPSDAVDSTKPDSKTTPEGSAMEALAGENPASSEGSSPSEDSLELVEIPEWLWAKITKLRILHSLGHSQSCHHVECSALRQELSDNEVLDVVYDQPLRYLALEDGKDDWRFTRHDFITWGLGCLHGVLVTEHCAVCEAMWIKGYRRAADGTIVLKEETDER